MTKTMTYVEAIEIAIATIDNEEAIGRLEALKGTLKKKKASTKKSDNPTYFDKVREALANGAMTPTDLMKVIDVANTQKVAAIIKDMGEEIVKDTKGKKVTYRLA